MLDLIKITFAVLGIFGAISFLGFKSYEFFGPKYRALDNKIFKESEQYNDSMLRDLEDLMFDYSKETNEEKKQSIKALARHRFGAYPRNKLSFEQIEFLKN